MASPNPNAQRVTKMLVTVNGWIASGAIDKVQGQVLSELTFAKEERIMQLADQIGVVTEVRMKTHVYTRRMRTQNVLGWALFVAPCLTRVWCACL